MDLTDVDISTKTPWVTERVRDGSWHVLGEDKQTNRLVLVAAFENEQDARAVVSIMNNLIA